MLTSEERRKRAEYMRGWNARNRDKTRARARDYAATHKDEAVERVRQWRIKNREKWLSQLRDHYAKNVDAKREKGRLLRVKHRDRFNAAARNRRNDARRKYEQEWQRRKFETDENFRIKTYIKRNIRNSLFRHGKQRKATSTTKLLGCSIDFLRGYLEARFQKGMNWGNYGKWHIDHIIPCAEFDLRNPVQQQQCFHYTNLRPLWAFDNISKKDKRPHSHQPEFL